MKSVLYVSDVGGHLGLAYRSAEEGLSSISTGYTVYKDQPISMSINEGLLKVGSWRPYIDKVDMVALAAHSPLGLRVAEQAERYKKAVIWFDPALVKATNHPDAVFEAVDLYDGYQYMRADAFPILVSIVGYWNGQSWADPVFVAFRDDHTYPGNLGPRHLGMGALVIPTEKHSLYDKTLAKLSDSLKKTNFRGFFEIDLKVQGPGFEPLAIHAPASFTVTEAIVEGMKDDYATLLLDTAFGHRTVIEVDHTYFIASQMLKPPASDFVKVEGLLSDVLRHTFPHSIAWIDDSLGWHCEPRATHIVTATARGRTVKEARRRVRMTLNNIEYPDKIYRVDVGARGDRSYSSKEEYTKELYRPFHETWARDVHQLQTWGWING